VHVSWYYFKREDGKWEKRYILYTKALRPAPLLGGRRRWKIEGFSCVANIASDRFGQQTLLSVQMVILNRLPIG